MYYITFVMKNNFFKLLEYLYYFSLVTLLILYLFPGSPIGYFLYGDSAKELNLVNNPIGTSINHLFFFIYLSFLGLTARLKEKKFINSFQFLIFISILLEIMHFLIPNRVFEFYDLYANSAGVIFSYLFIRIFLKKKIR